MNTQLKQIYSAEKVQRFELLFLFHDKEMKGFISSKDLPFILRAAGLLISDKEINDLQVKEKISKDDLFKLLIQLKDKRPVKQEIEASVKVFDEQNTGFIDTKELMGIVQQIGDEQVEKDFQLILNSVKGKENQVSIDSLVNLLMKE
ncbi:unnamed protein product [Paramecium pentaurelia]|uniref:Calmodulin n=1 Tax=Paramecium pentaurelia TaxID=43138 RepID=A0A8S1XHW4_9CILI|nr:unnamed protein product [Paramecium pentaurelia]